MQRVCVPIINKITSEAAAKCSPAQPFYWKEIVVVKFVAIFLKQTYCCIRISHNSYGSIKSVRTALSLGGMSTISYSRLHGFQTPQYCKKHRKPASLYLRNIYSWSGICFWNVANLLYDSMSESIRMHASGDTNKVTTKKVKVFGKETQRHQSTHCWRGATVS